MTSYELQFHAERDELITIAHGWVQRHELSLVVERFFPEYSPVAILGAVSVREAVDELAPVRRICVGRMELNVEGGFVTPEDFLAINRDCLAIILEPVTDDGLRETALATLTADQDTLEHWMALVLELEEIMHRGATAIDPLTGARMPAPEHRHTPGAHALAADGVTMLACAGPTYFEFDDVT
ncbi:MAG: hypothetical protein M3401_01050 [Actinomycetota bacterium]|nr:hypothetical protein [Actinomycetota bacterium]